MTGNWGEYISNITLFLSIFGPSILTGIALLFVTLDRKSDTQTKILWVLVIALIPVIGPIICLLVKPLLQKQA